MATKKRSPNSECLLSDQPESNTDLENLNIGIQGQSTPGQPIFPTHNEDQKCCSCELCSMAFFSFMFPPIGFFIGCSIEDRKIARICTISATASIIFLIGAGFAIYYAVKYYIESQI